ncbi:nuclear RNA export factor 1-like [Amia ocellicauda]|uniref:nuclear RNA export factor 1-like n=1 Tax=Amia ocellicauda TaxID=2972642 RepID=UPI003463BD61
MFCRTNKDSKLQWRDQQHNDPTGKKAGAQQGHLGGAREPVSTWLHDDDGDVIMNNSCQDGGTTQSPNGDDHNNRGGNAAAVRPKARVGNGDTAQSTDKNKGKQGGSGKTKDKKSWFKITIPKAKTYERTWLISALQCGCTVPFTPVQYHNKGSKVMFYVEGEATANALVKVSENLTDTKGNKVSITMNPAPPPSSVVNQLKPKDLDHLELCLVKRFYDSQQALDLKSIGTDPDLEDQKIVVNLNKMGGMQDINKIIAEIFPELVSLDLSNNGLNKLDEIYDLVSKSPNLKILNLSHNMLKSERELDKVKGFKLQELWLEHNPLCAHFKDQLSYISVIREMFPTLLRLDGHVLPRPTATEAEKPAARPATKANHSDEEEIKRVILPFLHDYYKVYDSGDRRPLIEAYHDGASFALNIPLTSRPRDFYGCNSRELKDHTTATWLHLRRRTRQDVAAFLNDLPKTQHDTSSFVVEVNAYTNTMLSFTVRGVFKDVDKDSCGSVNQFSRTFLTVPAVNAGLCVLSDNLYVWNPTMEKLRRAFVTARPMPPSSPLPTLTTEQQEMRSIFSLQSGMKLEWSQKCLQDNEWDFNKAAQIFTQFQAQGKIPDVAFK